MGAFLRSRTILTEVKLGTLQGATWAGDLKGAEHCARQVTGTQQWQKARSYSQKVKLLRLPWPGPSLWTYAPASPWAPSDLPKEEVQSPRCPWQWPAEALTYNKSWEFHIDRANKTLWLRRPKGFQCPGGCGQGFCAPKDDTPVHNTAGIGHTVTSLQTSSLPEDVSPSVLATVVRVKWHVCTGLILIQLLCSVCWDVLDTHLTLPQPCDPPVSVSRCAQRTGVGHHSRIS